MVIQIQQTAATIRMCDNLIFKAEEFFQKSIFYNLKRNVISKYRTQFKTWNRKYPDIILKGMT